MQGETHCGRPSAQQRHIIRHSAGEDGMETIQWHGKSGLLPSGCQIRKEEVGRGRGEEGENLSPHFV